MGRKMTAKLWWKVGSWRIVSGGVWRPPAAPNTLFHNGFLVDSERRSVDGWRESQYWWGALGGLIPEGRVGGSLFLLLRRRQFSRCATEWEEETRRGSVARNNQFSAFSCAQVSVRKSPFLFSSSSRFEQSSVLPTNQISIVIMDPEATATLTESGRTSVAETIDVSLFQFPENSHSLGAQLFN